MIGWGKNGNENNSTKLKQQQGLQILEIALSFCSFLLSY